MPDNQRIAKYVTQFNRLAMQVRWGQAALQYQFYKGLPSRLKDRISEVGKPSSLEELRNLAQALDHRYWERKAEQSRESSGSHKPLSSSSTKPLQDFKPHVRTSGYSGNPTSSSQTPTSPGTRNTSAPPRTPAKQAPKPYADKLGKDGKLTQEERQRRFANNLCLFCGGPGHTSANCPKKSSTPAKGRAVQASEESDLQPEVPQDSEPEEEPKN